MSHVAVQLPGAPAGVRVVPAPASTSGKPSAEAGQLAADRSAVAMQRAQLTQAHKALVSAAGQVAGLQRQLAAEAEQHVVELALGIARKVLMQEIRAGRYEIDPIVRETLSRVPPRADVVVRLNPDDYKTCDAAAEPAEGVRFIADASVPRAECVVQTAEGDVVSAIKPHLREIAEGLRSSD